MKKYWMLALTGMVPLRILACPVCGEKQPKPLKAITHGAGPESQWDYVIIIFIASLVMLTLYFSVKWIISPGEKSENHIKRIILPVDANGR